VFARTVRGSVYVLFYNVLEAVSKPQEDNTNTDEKSEPLNGIVVRIGVTVFLVLVALTLGSGGAVAQTQQPGEVIGQPDVTFGVQTGDVSAGAATDITVTITNRGKITRGGPEQHESRVTTARAMTMEFDDGGVPIDVDVGQIAVGNVPTGSVQTTVPITIEEDAEPGTYEIPLDYEYQSTRIADYDQFGVEYSDRTRTREDSISVVVTEDARFAVVETDATAQIGDQSDVSLTLRNTGSDPARDASVTAESKSGAVRFDSGSPSSTAFVGAWPSGETRTIEYGVVLAEDATRRDYTIDLSVGYEDTDGIETAARPMTAGLSTVGEQSFAFDDVTSTLRVGEDGDIVGTVTNTGTEPAGSVVVRYADDSTSVVPIEGSAAVGSLAAGQSADFRIPMETSGDSEAEAKSLDFAVQYRNGDGDRRVYEKLDVYADVAPERDQFNIEIADTTVEAGGSRTLAIRLTNNLDETVTDVEPELFTDDPLSSASDAAFLPELAPGETATVRFEISADGSATAKTQAATIDVRYDDADGDSKLSDTQRVAVEVVEPADGRNPLAIGGIALLVLVFAGGLYRWNFRHQ
jgi:sialidase-1